MFMSKGKELEAHRKSFSLLHPPFDTRKVATFVKPLLELLSKKDKQTITMTPLIKKLTFSIFSGLAYNENFDPFNLPNFYDLLCKMFKYVSFEPFILFPPLRLLFPISFFEFRRDLDQAHKVAHDLLEKNSVNDNNSISFFKKYAEEGILTQEAVENTIIAGFIGGHDTTDSTIMSTLYCLAKHQDVQEKVYQELVSVVGKEDIFENGVNESLMENLSYMTKVIKEALRMYPPVPYGPFKVTTQDTVLAGYKVPKDTVIMIDFFAMHYTEKYWPDPYKFDPSRFDDEKNYAHFAYLPFGAGSRSCYGRHFAFMEIRNIISMLLMKYKVTLPPDSPHRDEPIFRITGLLVIEDLRLTFTRRK